MVRTAAAPSRENAMNTTSQRPRAEEDGNHHDDSGKTTNSHVRPTPPRPQRRRPSVLETVAEYLLIPALSVMWMLLLFR